MTKTQKIYSQIEDLENLKIALRERLKKLEYQLLADDSVYDDYYDTLEQIHETDIAIGECEGALAEINYVDNGCYCCY